MHNRHLALESDALLRSTQRDRERPHYGDQWFRRKLRIARARDRRLAAELLPKNDTIAREVLLSELRRSLAAAGLTPLQAAVMTDYLLGLSWVEVAARHGHSKQAAQQTFRAAVKKVRAKRACDPYAGLTEVYRAEVSRRGRSV